MKRIIILFLIIAMLFVSGCASNNFSIGDEIGKQTQPEVAGSENNTSHRYADTENITTSSHLNQSTPRAFSQTEKGDDKNTERCSAFEEIKTKQPLSTNLSTSVETTKIVSTESYISTTIQNSKADNEDLREIANIIVRYINAFRAEQGTAAAIKLSGLTQYAEYRSRQLVSNFAHNTKDERAAATALKYGQYVDPSKYGMTGEAYYTANAGEAIAKAGYVGTVDYVAEKLALLIRNSPEHWAYVGSSEYRYIAVGITYNSGMWYCDVAVAIDNSDLL